jgi:uncharacterized protein YceK
MDKHILIFDIVIIGSVYLLVSMVTLPHSKLDITSKLRFLCLIGVHGIILVWTIALVFIYKCYRRVIFHFAVCFIIVVAMSGCEIVIRKIEADPFYNYKKRAPGYDHLELMYLGCYFIVYVVAMLGLLATFAIIAGT